MYWGCYITEEKKNRVEKRVWSFIIFDGLKVHLDAIIDMDRPTTRHKYKRVNAWTRIDRRNNTMERIIPPSYILDEVRNRINKAIEFV